MRGARGWFLVVAVVAAVWGAAVPAVASNDPFFPDQWGLSAIHAPEVWPSDTAAGVTIGIVDTGVDLSHPDLAGRIAASTACINTGGDPSRCGGSGDDIDGHGTHVTGIAVANAGNGQGIAGVAPNARVVVARVFQPSTDQSKPGMTATVADVNAGIKWVVSQGARVVNLSLGLDPGRPPPSNFLIFGGQGPTLGQGVEWAWSAGAVPVLAAGNDANGQVDYPNAHAIIVGAARKNGSVASYSTSLGNSRWGMVAPGGENSDPSEGIVSTWTQGRYAYLAGTSMAVPHVAAAVALLLAQGLNRDSAVQQLLNSADKIGCGSGCQGFLDVSRAVGVNPAPTATSLPSTGGSGSTSPPATTRPRRTTTPAGSAPAIVTPPPSTTPPPTVPEPSTSSLPPETTTSVPRSNQVTLRVNPSNDDSGRPVAASVVAGALLVLVLIATAATVRRRRAV
ncbi:MAG: S8 family serine peptidase [Actinobacteria bacterium]|nr:S8 family serine peptidase [Actinomycetota bacterium]MBV9935888.1 S8 family serine peptidase [Actinomycetota bacterium]